MEKKMSKGRAERAKVVEELKDLFESSQGGVLTDFRGLNVAQISDLRRKFREQNVSYHVVKNTLTSIAVTGTVYEGLKDQLTGPTGIGFGSDDPVAAARVAVEFAKDKDKLKIKGGFIEDEVLGESGLTEISKLGGRKDLMAMLLAAMNGPSQKFLGVLNGVPRDFLGVLKAQADKLESA